MFTTASGECVGSVEVPFFVEEGPIPFFTYDRSIINCPRTFFNPLPSVAFTVAPTIVTTYATTEYNYSFEILLEDSIVSVEDITQDLIDADADSLGFDYMYQFDDFGTHQVRFEFNTTRF